jgi:hypothetical protein
LPQRWLFLTQDVTTSLVTSKRVAKDESFLLCRSPEQAIGIGLSKTRRVGVKLPVPPTLRSWEDGFSGLISDLKK